MPSYKLQWLLSSKLAKPLPLQLPFFLLEVINIIFLPPFSQATELRKIEIKGHWEVLVSRHVPSTGFMLSEHSHFWPELWARKTTMHGWWACFRSHLKSRWLPYWAVKEGEWPSFPLSFILTSSLYFTHFLSSHTVSSCFPSEHFLGLTEVLWSMTRLSKNALQLSVW